MNASQIQAAFDDSFDHALVFHGYADYTRDYDAFVYVTANPGTGIAPDHLRYRFRHCVRASTTSALPLQTWKTSLDERLLDMEQAGEIDGYVWGVKWQNLYPGMHLVPDSPEAQQWSRNLDLPFHEATIETNTQKISLVFSDLSVGPVTVGYAPFVVTDY